MRTLLRASTGRSRAALLLAVAVLLACGGGPHAVTTRAPIRVDATRLLLDLLAERVPSLRAPAEPSEALATALRAARGAERLTVSRNLALASLAEAERDSDARRARRSRRTAARLARDVARRTHDTWVAAEMDFVGVLAAWLGGDAREAERLAGAFVERRARDGGELLVFAWMVRGELALAARRWDDAATDYRFVLGQLEHPLYAFGLWRTAQCYRELGRASDAQQALREVDGIGDRPGAHPAARQVADAARSELGLPPRGAARADDGA